MYAPCRAREVTRAQGICPGVCRARIAGGSTYGFFVEYQERAPEGEIPERHDAVIELFVKDDPESSTFSGVLPFVIDTGSPMTIVPRRLVPESAFPLDRALRRWAFPVTGIGGAQVAGHLFFASLSVSPPHSKYKALSFEEMKVVVVDGGKDVWHEDYGLLGLDAIRRVVLVADSDHVCLWPRR